MTFQKALASLVASLWLLAIGGCSQPQPGTVLDEAMRAGRTAESFPASADDYFVDMDGGYKRDSDPSVKLTTEEMSGRNTWIVWTGGNDRFWDYMSNNTFGAFDLLKIMSSNPHIGFCIGPDKKLNDESEYSTLTEAQCKQNGLNWYTPNRSNRFRWYGLVNEPCFEQATGPDEYGLWLDRRKKDCPADPFEDETKYPGVKIGARGTKASDGKESPVWSFYGKATGIVGLRLFPNPDFNEAAKKTWDEAVKKTPDAFYTDPDFYNTKKLIRPYRVGMSCGFCHVGPAPSNPPADPENPAWANLNSNPGAQYFWVDRIFAWNPQNAKSSFIYQLFHTSQPGSLDTSFVSTDSINNPRTMNAVYSLGARLEAAKQWKEKLAGGERDNKQFHDFPQTKVLSGLFQPPETVFTPRVLKDGSDSVGALGALNRVFLNIGLFSEEWLLHFNPLVGGKTITPIPIATAEKNSAYWRATAQQTPNMALFFLKTAQPDKLADTPYGKANPPDPAKLERGMTMFAENCARCHSSKQPPNLCMLGQPCKAGQIIENTAEYFEWQRNEVKKPDFLVGNFLSTDRRVSIQELGINACSPLATNAIRDNIWDNFSSETYKELPGTGQITVFNPVDGTPWTYNMRAGGRGYARPASLTSIWATAPFLQNNTVGPFNPDPSVEGRLDSFNKSIEQMLWPEKRDKDPLIGDRIAGPSRILRTTSRSYLKVPSGYLPGELIPFSEWGAWLNRLLPWAFDKEGDLQLGPIPKNTPVSLLANIELMSESTRPEDRIEHFKKVIEVVFKLKKTLKSLPKDVTEEQLDAAFRPLVPDLLSVSKCPDYIVNKGHYFGSNLADDDKHALIEFLKTF
jgi:hypothetical protein